MAKLDLAALPIPAKLRGRPLPPTDLGLAWWAGGPFVAVHLMPLGALFTGASAEVWAWFVALYFVRMFAVTGGYHRYFSHRTFKTGRAFQFVLAFLAQMSAQRGVLWWAAHHRTHHKFSDTPWDVHSPIRTGFRHSHMGWLFVPGLDATDEAKVRDLARYPELRWLNRNWWAPPVTLALLCLAFLGWPGLFITFALGTVVSWHATFTINSLSHVFGRRRFPTTDTSRNNWFLALLTLGEGWHNNHHHYQSSTRQGFYWWEVDVTYYVLRALAAVGLVWDLRPVPAEVLAEGRRRDAVASTAAVIEAEEAGAADEGVAPVG